MIHYEVAERYAKALFNLVASKEHMLARKEVLSEIVLLFEKKPRFRTFLLNPEISKYNKKNLLQKGISDPQLLDFLFLLLEKGKFKYLPEIADKYYRMISDYSRIIEAILVTATAIDSGLKAKLKERLEKSYEKEINIHEKIDPQLIGGAILIIGNKIIDFSIEGRLEGMKKTLLGK